MDECLRYFRQVLADPETVPPWDEWWSANAELVATFFPLIDYVRLKHRGVEGVRQLLAARADTRPETDTLPE